LGTAETEAASAVKTPQSEFPPAKANLCSFSNEASRFAIISRVSMLYRSLLYAVIVFISFFLMLVFMTYNVRDNVHTNCGVRLLTARLLSPLQAYLILATVAGAGIGHYLFSEFGVEGDDKGMACH